MTGITGLEKSTYCFLKYGLFVATDNMLDCPYQDFLLIYTFALVLKCVRTPFSELFSEFKNNFGSYKL